MLSQIAEDYSINPNSKRGKRQFYYGWVAVAICLLLLTAAYGIRYSFGVFFKSLEQEFGWTRALTSEVFSLYMLLCCLFAFLGGWAADRYGAKKVVIVLGIFAFISLSLTSQANSLWHLFLSYSLLLAIGTGPVYAIVMSTATRWFKKNLGKATGIIAAGIGIGGLTTPIITRLIDIFDWRITMIILAALVAVIGIPMAFVFRSRPEDYSMLPDGAPQSTADDANKYTQYDFGTTVKEAIKTRAFWHFGIASFCQVTVSSSVILHVMPYLTSLGIERTTASMIAMFIPLVSIPARLVYGWLSDIFTKKYVFAVSNVLTSIGLFFFSIISDSSSIITVLFIIFFSFGLAGLQPTRVPIVREYFGTKNFGAILGMTFIFVTLGTMLSPPIAGWVYDLRGVYDPYWLILSGVALVAAVSISTMPLPPQRSGSVPNS